VYYCHLIRITHSALFALEAKEQWKERCPVGVGISFSSYMTENST